MIYTSIKLTGLFKTKRQGMYVGSVSVEVMEELLAMMNTSKAQKNGLVLFAFKNDKGGDRGPVLNLLIDVSKPREDSTEWKAKRKLIQEDHDLSDEDEVPVKKKFVHMPKPVTAEDDDF
jgi:hypothetical protein